MARIRSIPVSSLARRLEVSPARLEDVLRREQFPIFETARGYSLRQRITKDVETLLQEHARRLRHEDRMRPTGSKYWLSGYPELIAEWHPTKNAGLYPDEVSYGSGLRIWWKCSKGPDHEWSCVAKQRTDSARGTRCPFCAGKRVSVTNSLETLFPKLVREWHPKMNGHLTPADVTGGAARRVWWKCPKGDDHVWRAYVYDRTFGIGCPFCTGQKTSKKKSIAVLFPKLSREWHPKKNGDLRPRDVLPQSDRDVWWRCRRDQRHEWSAPVSSRTTRGDGCPFCSGHRLSPTNSLAAAYPTVAKEWHWKKNAPVTPDVIYGHTTNSFWWKCPVAADHEWKQTVANRTLNESGCPFCAGRKASKTNSLAAQRPDLVREWHPTKNRRLTPRDVVVGSARDAWWRCRRGHVWSTQVRTRGIYGTGCPECRRLDTTRAHA
jgi:hypothetical protein